MLPHINDTASIVNIISVPLYKIRNILTFICFKLFFSSLFSKLALLLRQRITAFGHDVQISVRCLQTLVQAIDAK